MEEYIAHYTENVDFRLRLLQRLKLGTNILWITVLTRSCIEPASPSNPSLRRDTLLSSRRPLSIANLTVGRTISR